MNSNTVLKKAFVLTFVVVFILPNDHTIKKKHVF